MTWKQVCIDLMVLLIREGRQLPDIAPIFSTKPTLICTLLKSRGYSVKELKRMNPLPQEERCIIIQEFCNESSNREALRSVLHSQGIRFEDFAAQPLPNPMIRDGHYVPVTPEISERNKEVAECRRKGMTFGAIGEKYGISRQRVRQIIVRFNIVSENPVDIKASRVLAAQPSPAIQERRRKVVELCRAGLTYQQMADTMGIEKKYIFQDVARHNRTEKRPLKVRRAEHHKETSEVRKGIIQGHKKGLTHNVLAEQYNISYGTVFRVLKSAGLTAHRDLRKIAARKKAEAARKSAKKRTGKRNTKKKKTGKRTRR
jgi:DNA-binding NarL/FixJ family response regulator